MIVDWLVQPGRLAYLDLSVTIAIRVISSRASFLRYYVYDNPINGANTPELLEVQNIIEQEFPCTNNCKTGHLHGATCPLLVHVLTANQ